MRRKDERLTGELRTDREWRVETQFLIGGEPCVGRRFANRALTLTWAELGREVRRQGGWTDQETPR